MKLWRWVYFAVFVLLSGLLYQWFFSASPSSEQSSPAEFGFESVDSQAFERNDSDEFSDDPVVADLVKRMQLADALEKPDLLESALDRLLLLEPNHPAAFFFQAQKALINDDVDRAKAILEARKLADPDSLATRQLSAYILSMTSKRNALQQARIFRRAARYGDALTIYKALFPDGMPSLKLELELLDVLSFIEGKEAHVLSRLIDLNREYPDVALLELTLAEFQSRQNPHDPAALATYRRLAQGDGLGRRAADSWLRTLGRLPLGSAVLADYALLAERYPSDLSIQNSYRNVLKQQAEERERLKDPYDRAKKQGLALLEANRVTEAEPLLRYALRGRSEDAEVNGGVGTVYMRRGDHDRALHYFKNAARYNQDPDMNSKWASLIKASSYWSSLRRAEAYIKSGKYQQAQEELNIALEIDPSNPETYVGLADLAIANAKPLTADVYYLEALRRDSSNRSALWGRVQLRQAVSGRRAALELADTEYSAPQRRRIAEQLQSLRIDEDLEALAGINPQRNRDGYIAAINRVLARQPTSPWQRSDLATGLVTVGEQARGDALMADWADKDKSAEMRFAYGLYLSARGDVKRAVSVLESIPADQRSAAMQSNLMRLSLEQNLAGIQAPISDNSVERSRQLDQLISQYQSQPIALLRLAEICVDLGERERAEDIARRLVPEDSWAFESQLDYGRLLLSLDQFDQFMRWQQRWRAESDSPAEQAQLDDLSLEYDLARARYYTERGDMIIAYSMYQRAAEHTGAGQLSARISLLKMSVKMANQAELSAQSDAILQGGDSLSSGDILDIAQLLHDADATSERDRYMSLLETRSDLSAQQLRQAMLLEKSARDWDASEKYAYAAWQQVRVEDNPALATQQLSQKQLYQLADDDYWLTSSVKSTIDDIRERRDGYIKFGIDHNFRSGSDTTSQIPVEVRWPVPSLDGHLLFRVDYVSVKSGTVDYLEPGASPPTTITRVPFSESARGMAIGVGWEADKWHADIGTTPIGFRESNIVGSAGVKGSLGDVGWNAVLSQRPEVSSTLSYAGMEVPLGANFAGAEWGGVILSGAKLGLSYDLGGANGYWASLQYHLITGDQVADNTRIGLLGGVYHRVIDEEDRKFRVGLNVLHFQYDKNLSEDTLQHGSYFSPQNYISVSLPVRYFGRHGSKLSYLLGASISNSWSSEDAPYLLGTGSSSGGGFGYSIEAALEKRVSKRWYVGLAADIQRADFYEPNHVVMYAKYTFNDRWQPIWTPPEPPIPYSDFD